MTVLRKAALVASVAAIACLSGCGSKTFSGRVINGPATVVLPVVDTDDRLQRQGIADVSVSLREEGTGREIASATTDAAGAFELRLADDTMPSRLRIIGTGDGLPPIRERTRPLAPGEQYLVVVRQSSNIAAPEPASADNGGS